MTPRETPEGSAETRRADPAAVERELAELWRAEAEALKRATGGERMLARVLLHSLVVYAAGHEPADQAREMAVALSPRQPARTIIMEIDETPAAAGGPTTEGPGPAEPEAWVTLHCARARNGSDRVCGEQITFEAAAGALQTLPGAVLPLLLPNLPAFLWWQSGSPFGQPLFVDLLPGIDRLIVDSATFGEGIASGLHELAELAADPSPAVFASDLTWARLSPWRYQTAHFFDDPAMRTYLNQLDRVTVSYFGGSPMHAWLYAAWLGSRLGWKLMKDEGGRLKDEGMWRFEGGQGVEFRPEMGGPGDDAGHLAAVHLAAGEGATFEVRRVDATCTAARMVAGDLRTERVMPLRGESPIECLGHELERLSRSPVYEAALRLLAGA